MEAPVRRPGLRKQIKWLALCLGAAPALAWLTFGLLSWLCPFPKADLETVRRNKESTRVYDRDGRLLLTFNGEDDTRMFWVSLAQVSPCLVQATVAVEDERFFWHPGVDPIAVVRAAGTNVRRGRVVSGASTLTMQVMRMLWRRPRTFGNKLIEAFRALQAEDWLSKNEILETYLNLAPYGGNLVGVEAASLAYFRKHARDMTLGEAALLAGLPQSPSRLRPDRAPERARQRRTHVLKRMCVCGFIAPADAARAEKEPIPSERFPPPFDVPQWAFMLQRLRPQDRELRTTLDGRLQELAETAIRSQVDRLRPAGVTNGAAIVIENRSAAVRAFVASCDFFSGRDQGQVNGATALRSPGSALKPFAYALAFDRGICAPGTVLPDVPLSFGHYEPQNYDRSFRGLVTARHALNLSLNVPVVELLRRLGFQGLYDFLRGVGITTLEKSAEHYGLSLVLGSVPVNLLELTNAYATLGREGVCRPFRVLEADPAAEGRPVLSPEAAFLVSDILSDPERLDGQVLWKSSRSQVRMAWKTGTSFGHRDAWCFAYTPEYTVGVWLGDFSGQPSRELVGQSAAAPVAARIIDQIQSGKPVAWFERPESVEDRKVCAVSGMSPGPCCGRLTDAPFIRGRSPEQACETHVQVKIDRDTGSTLCHACAAGRTCDLHVAESWPAEVASWLRIYEPTRPLAPPHFAECPSLADAGSPPKILSPLPGQVFVLSQSQGAQSQRLLLRAASSQSDLFWFVNQTLYRTAKAPAHVFWPLRRGRHTIACSNQVGQTHSVTIEVR
jgi:penicillin-binding protein 1C